MRLTVVTVLMALFLAVVPNIGHGTVSKQWRIGRWSPGTGNVYNAIYYEFCGHKYRLCWEGANAVRVSSCETGGTFSVWAENGQYKNIFQMGTSERQKYGWHTVGSDPWKASRAAYNYYVASGRDWSPWSCKP